MPFTAPAEYPYSDDSSPGANDGDVVYANIVNVVMEYLQDTLPTDITDATGVVASDDNPEDLGTPDPGVGTELSRSDHVHQMPSAADVGAATESYVDDAITAHSADTDPHGDRAYADSLFASLDSGNYQGTIDCSGNPDYPAADADDTYRVSAAGKIGGASGVDVEIGDLAICLDDSTASGDQATVGSSWTIVQGNLNGVVLGPASSVDDRIVTFNGTSGQLIQQASVTVADLDDYTVDDTNDWPGTDPTTQTDALDNLAARVTTNAAAIYTFTANTQTSSYTLVIGDAGKVVEMNSSSALDLTVPPNSSVAFDIGTVIELYAMGTGTVTVVEGSGVTVRNAGDLDGQYATASLRKRATDEWVLSGELV